MPANTYALAMNYNCGGQFCTNVWHYQFDDGGFTTTAQAASALITAYVAANFTLLRAILSTHTTIVGAKCRRVTNAGGFEGNASFTSSNTGTRTGTMMAAGIGAVLIWYAVGNTKQRGRTFIPGVSDLDAADGIITAAFATALGSFSGGMRSPLLLTGGGSPTATFGMYNRVTRAFSTIADSQVSNMIGQVRRRQLPV